MTDKPTIDSPPTYESSESSSETVPTSNAPDYSAVPESFESDKLLREDMRYKPATTTSEDDAEEADDESEATTEPEGPVKFSTSLYDALMSKTGLHALFLTPCLFGATNTLLNRKPDVIPEEALKGHKRYFNLPCVGYTGVSLLAHGFPALVWRAQQRSSIRNKYGIEGNLPKDVLTVAFCSPCSLAQEYIEVESRESKSVSFELQQKQAEDEYLV